MIVAGSGTGRARGGGPEPGQRSWQLPAAAACALSLAACVVVVSGHHLLTWLDLAVYDHAGLLARAAPQRLYSWQLRPGIRFTYPPFAALVFAVASLLPWAVLKWLMVVASLAALGVSIWLTLGALGRAGRARVTAVLGLAAVALWAEPVQHGLGLGQVELPLMALIVWDLCQPDRRWWKGAGIGVAAGIKLTPLIFIPYLVLCGKLRQAAVAAAAFAGTVAAGFAVLPGASARWWWTGYFLQAGKAGDAASPVNQSLFALLARAGQSVAHVAPAWLAAAAAVAAAGLAAGAVLHRSGQPVAGWVTCALTGLLVSPISWDHHWVWVVPVLAVLADAAQRARGAARWAHAAAAAAVAVVFGGWPSQWAGPLAFVPRGLLGFFPGRFGPDQEYHLHGLQVIGWNLYVLAGLVMLAAAVAAVIPKGTPRFAVVKGTTTAASPFAFRKRLLHDAAGRATHSIRHVRAASGAPSDPICMPQMPIARKPLSEQIESSLLSSLSSGSQGFFAASWDDGVAGVGAASARRLALGLGVADPKKEPQPGARQLPGGAQRSRDWVGLELAGQAAVVPASASGSGPGMRARVTSKPRAPSLPTWWAIWRRVSRWRS